MHQEIQIFSTMDQDIFASQLRSQIYKLNSILENFENRQFNPQHSGTLVKEIETNLRRIRKTWLDN